MKKQIKLIKEIIDDFEKVKTKEFMNYFYEFMNFFNTYFEDQAIEYINGLKDNKDIKKAKDPKINKELIEKLSAIVLL
ncbi:hypothetical protein HOG21_00865 [bacterium]|jgi:hypothetical protein|nr:hypothetical protein [bacterium]